MMAGSVGLPRWSPSYFERKGFHNPPFPWLLITASSDIIDKGIMELMRSILVEIMTRRVVGAKPLLEPMLIYYN